MIEKRINGTIMHFLDNNYVTVKELKQIVFNYGKSALHDCVPRIHLGRQRGTTTTAIHYISSGNGLIVVPSYENVGYFRRDGINAKSYSSVVDNPKLCSISVNKIVMDEYSFIERDYLNKTLGAISEYFAPNTRIVGVG